MNILKSTILIAFVSASLVACKYNVGETDKTKDLNADNEYVYGDKGQPARQTKNTYADTPEGATKADKIREKFYGNSSGSNLAETSTPKDSTTKKAEEKKTEEKK